MRKQTTPLERAQSCMDKLCEARDDALIKAMDAFHVHSAACNTWGALDEKLQKRRKPSPALAAKVEAASDLCGETMQEYEAALADFVDAYHLHQRAVDQWCPLYEAEEARKAA
jgi:hypothetical protein